MMDNDRMSAMYMGGDPMAMLPGSSGGGAPSQSLWDLLDDRLRGRWTYMLMIGGLLAGILAFVGYQSTQPSFKSRGIVRVADSIQGIEGGRLNEMIRPETERATQALLIRSRRVLEQALKDEKLAASKLASDPDVLMAIEENLIVEFDRNSELIFVSFESASPETAQNVVHSVVHAYFDIFGNQGGEEMSQNLRQLWDEEAEISRQIKAVQADISTRLVKYETTDLRSWQERKQKRMDELDSQLTQAKALLARSEAKKTEEGLPEASAVPVDATLERMSPSLAQMGQNRDDKFALLQDIKSRFQPESHQVRNAERAYEAAKGVYEQERLKVIEEWQLSGGVGPSLLGAADTQKLATMSPEQLRGEITLLETGIAALSTESAAATADIVFVDTQNNEMKRLQGRLDWVRSRIAELELNSQRIVKGRISIAQEAERPLEVSSDGRKKRAAAGAAGGFALSFAAFFLLGTIDRRAYGAQQLKSAAGRIMPPCLGVLPDLSKSGTDPEANDVAAHCVHQIRNQIEAQRPGDQGFVLAITSPCQGDGKTSIVLSLGWSYAAAGYRTLMIDCDLVGRSLTRQLGMVGKEGLREALVRKSVNGEVVNLSMPGLSAMPSGFDATFGPERIRRHALDVLFEQVRPHYDVILIDTGPILGSLESTPVISAADGVVLTVRRGRARNKLDEAVGRLDTLRGNCIGVVLNWAVRADCYRYVSETSLPAADRDVPAEDAASVTIAAPSSGTSNALILAMEKAATPQRPASSSAPASHTDHES